MVVNIYNSSKYSLIFDINDLNKNNINIVSLCGNSSKLPTYINKLLENENFSNNYILTDFELFTFDFKIFKVTFNVAKIKSP